MNPDDIIDALKDTRGSEALNKWCATPLHDLERGSFSGWSMPQLIGQVRSRGPHEIANHGFTHLPWLGLAVSDDDRTFELSGIRNWSREIGLNDLSFVFPRNLVSNIHRLGEAGIVCYRLAPKCSSYGPLGRAKNLLSELRDFVPEPARYTGPPIAVPGGLMLHWKQGLRRSIPVGSSVRRVTSALVHNGNYSEEYVVHLWLHPHNLITGKNQVSLLSQVLKSVALARDQGYLIVDTMSSYREYCQDKAARRPSKSFESPPQTVSESK